MCTNDDVHLEANEPERRAVVIAALLHDGQVRKFSGEPYIQHPQRVAAIVRRAGGTSAQVQAALLHDTVEDTGYTLAALAAEFGPQVASIVEALTRVEGERYEDFIARAAAHPLARLVKRADLLDNLSTLPERHAFNARYTAALSLIAGAGLAANR